MIKQLFNLRRKRGTTVNATEDLQTFEVTGEPITIDVPKGMSVSVTVQLAGGGNQTVATPAPRDGKLRQQPRPRR